MSPCRDGDADAIFQLRRQLGGTRRAPSKHLAEAEAGGVTFHSSEQQLTKLLDGVDSGAIQLPDFQRDWVWDDERVRSLLASVSMSYPIGTLMLLDAGNEDVRFASRPVQGAMNANGTPGQLILDGQQRLTTLYQALQSSSPVQTRDSRKKPIERWYYFHIPKAIDPTVDREDAIVAVGPDRKNRDLHGVTLDLSTREREWVAEMLPARLLHDGVGLMKWQLGYFNAATGDEQVLRQQQWEWLLDRLLGSFNAYLIPVITMMKETPRDAVCQVFEKVNTGGVTLNVFELLTATYAADNVNLRDRWTAQRDVMQQHPVLGSVESTDYLQAGTVHDKLVRWYWCGVFGELYGSTIESRFANDLVEVIDWVDGGPEPTTVAQAAFQDNRLDTMRARQSAAYKGLHALLMRDGAQDFKSATPITIQQYVHESVDIHHVFPQRWCKDNGIDRGTMDSIVNKTPLSAETNREIGGRAPSDYLARLERTYQMEPSVLDQHLTTHVIDPTLLRADAFDAFYQARKEQLLRRIEGVTGKRILREVADDVLVEDEQVEPEPPTVAELTALVPVTSHLVHHRGTGHRRRLPDAEFTDRPQPGQPDERIVQICAQLPVSAGYGAHLSAVETYQEVTSADVTVLQTEWNGADYPALDFQLAVHGLRQTRDLPTRQNIIEFLESGIGCPS
ncbi:MAG: GmrSD restriction endonuclease domain-containing protein, partial [Pseudonocardiaceae bacterium]